MGEDAGVARLRDLRAAHLVRDGESSVFEVHTILGVCPAGLAVVAVKVQYDLAVVFTSDIGVPHRVWAGYVRHTVLLRNNILDERVIRVLSPRSVKAVGVRKRDATGVLVGSVVHIPLPERFAEVLSGIEDAGENDFVGRVVAQGGRLDGNALVSETRPAEWWIGRLSTGHAHEERQQAEQETNEHHLGCYLSTGVKLRTHFNLQKGLVSRADGSMRGYLNDSRMALTDQLFVSTKAYSHP